MGQPPLGPKPTRTPPRSASLPPGTKTGPSSAPSIGPLAAAKVDVPQDGTALVDHAIFTSVPGPTGEGYRIIAATYNVRPNEKATITRRAPSHEGLCDLYGAPAGLLAFPLGAGRVCIGACYPAGAEHTGRGGARIVSHFVILEKDAYRRFDANPVRVHAALLATIRGQALPKPGTQLEPLNLPIASTALHGPQTTPTGFTASRDEDNISYIISAALRAQAVSWVVVGTRAPLAALEWALLALPLPIRERVAVSTGLRYSLGRQLQLALINEDSGETQRAIRGQPVRWLDVCNPAQDVPPPCELWLQLLRIWWNAGRFDHVCNLTRALPDDVQPRGLERLASISLDLMSARTGKADLHDRLRAKYRDFTPANDTEEVLLRELQAVIEPEIDQAEASAPSPPAPGMTTRGSKLIAPASPAPTDAPAPPSSAGNRPPTTAPGGRPATPGAPGRSSASATPARPSTPGGAAGLTTPGAPGRSSAPPTPGRMSAPTSPSAPGRAPAPGAPTTPGMPTTPGAPTAPGSPTAPGTPGRTALPPGNPSRMSTPTPSSPPANRPATPPTPGRPTASTAPETPDPS
jgi:hypothetical protein